MSIGDYFLDIKLTRNTLDLYYIRLSILKSIEKQLGEFNGILLDLGCGNMPYKKLLLSDATNVKKYIGIDIHEQNVLYTEKPDFFWDGVKIPLEDESIDCVLMTEVFEHCPDIKIVLTEVKRVLKPNGFIFFTVPFLWPLHETPYDEFRYTPYSLERIFKLIGFRNIHLQPTGGWHSSMAQMMGLWVIRSPMNSFGRKILIRVLKPIVAILIKMDKQEQFNENLMITGITGMAYK